jgi:hypothetical protein
MDLGDEVVTRPVWGDPPPPIGQNALLFGLTEGYSKILSALELHAK